MNADPGITPEENSIALESFGQRCKKCNTVASFSRTKESSNPKVCSKHIIGKMVNVFTYEESFLRKRVFGKSCYVSGCVNIPTFKKDNISCSCTKHVDIGYKLIKYRLCHYPDCYRKNSFGNFCIKHRIIDVKKSDEGNCKYCIRDASYGIDKYATNCRMHMEEGMHLINLEKCVDCDAIPFYGYGKSRTHCELHKKNKMNLCKYFICKAAGCTSRAAFNLPSSKIPLFCKEHKGAKMTICYALCNKRNCEKIAKYGKNTTQPEVCEDHKEEHMFYAFVYDLCMNCSKKTASFTYINNDIREYCSDCKKPGMINIKLFKLCEEKNCRNHGIFTDIKNNLLCEAHLKPKESYKSIICEFAGCFNRIINNRNTCRRHSSRISLNE